MGLPSCPQYGPAIRRGQGILNTTSCSRCYSEAAYAELPRVLCCEKVLHYRFDWRYIYAMLIGYARVSTDDQGPNPVS